MKAGTLRHRVIIEAPALLNDDQGGAAIVSWVPIPGGHVWADIRAMSAREVYQHGVMSQSTSHTLTIRYLAGVQQGMRVRAGNRTFEIQAVRDESQRKVQLELVCDEQHVGATT